MVKAAAKMAGSTKSGSLEKWLWELIVQVPRFISLILQKNCNDGGRENRIMTKSEKLFERAVKRIPGGGNSPVRAYGAIGEAPRFIERAEGCYNFMNVDGNRYIDYIDSWGPNDPGTQFSCNTGKCSEGL